MMKERIFYEKNAPQAGFFDSVLIGTLSCQYSNKFIFHESQLRIFFF